MARWRKWGFTWVWENKKKTIKVSASKIPKWKTKKYNPDNENEQVENKKEDNINVNKEN